MAPAYPRHWLRRNTFNPERLALLSGSVVLGLLMVAGMGAPRNWWTHNLQLSFRTSNAAGLKPGMQVMISGYPVGRVRQIRLLNDAQVQVTLSVGAGQEHMIGPRSRASLSQDNLLDKPYIAITPDLHDPKPSEAPNQPLTLTYEASPSLATLIRELASSRLPLQQVIGNTARLVDQRLPRTLDQLDRTLISGQRLAGSAERELVGQSGGLRNGVSAAATNLERTLTSLQTTLSEIQTLARSSNALLQGISRSWLLQLLQPADQPQPAPSEPQLRNKRE
jgi:phospholipid/cholesterol/gamma-HCH transport system substrate-binding protein